MGVVLLVVLAPGGAPRFGAVERRLRDARRRRGGRHRDVAAGADARSAHGAVTIRVVWPSAVCSCLPISSNDALPATDDASHAILNCVRPMVHLADGPAHSRRIAKLHLAQKVRGRGDAAGLAALVAKPTADALACVATIAARDAARPNAELATVAAAPRVHRDAARLGVGSRAAEQDATGRREHRSSPARPPGVTLRDGAASQRHVAALPGAHVRPAGRRR